MGSVDFFHAEFRNKRAGFPDLLRWASTIRPGVVLGKGGELIATFAYQGPDMQCASQDDLNFLRVRVEEMVRGLRSGWMLHSTSIRKDSVDYDDFGAFPDAVTRAIENERIKQYQQEGAHYENDYFLTFTYLPEPIFIGKIKEFAYDTSDRERMNPKKIAVKSIEYFEQQMANYVSILQSGLGSKFKRLAPYQELDPISKRMIWYDEQLAFLHSSLTGSKQRIRLPEKAVPTGVDYLLGSYGFLPGIRPKLGDNFIRVVAIESPPDAGTVFGMLEMLNKLGVKFRWSTRWIARDSDKAKASTQKIRSKWRQKIRGFIADVTGRQGGAINQDAVNMAADAEAVLNDLEAGSVAYGQWTSVVVLNHRDTAYLETAVRFLIKNISDLGFVCRDEDINCTEAFLGSLPGHGYENVRRPEIHSMNLADCLPLTSVWQGPVNNPCSFYKKYYPDGKVPPLLQGSASGGTPFRMVLHNGDVGHTVIVGPTGAGKSTLLGMIAAAHFRYPSARFYGFEKGESMLALCLGMGGAHFNFLDDDTDGSELIGFAPFSKLDRLSDRVWATDYVETILTLNNLKVDYDISAEISRAINLLQTRPPEMRSFTDLNQLIQIRSVQQILSMYERDLAGGMLNAKKDSVEVSRCTVFEMEKLMDMKDKHVVPVLLYLFRMIERSLDGSPTIICLDEAWLMLQHEMFQEKLKEWLKVLRKANAMIIFATQELNDLADSPIASTVFSACQTRILLPNAGAMQPDSLALYKSIGLSEREVELLTVATPKRDYLFSSPAGKRLFQLELGPVALAFVAASGADDRRIVKDLYSMHGSNWVGYWLRQKGVDPAVLGNKAILDMETKV